MAISIIKFADFDNRRRNSRQPWFNGSEREHIGGSLRSATSTPHQVILIVERSGVHRGSLPQQSREISP